MGDNVSLWFESSALYHVGHIKPHLKKFVSLSAFMEYFCQYRGRTRECASLEEEPHLLFGKVFKKWSMVTYIMSWKKLKKCYENRLK